MQGERKNMIQSRNELKAAIEYERGRYFSSSKDKLRCMILNNTSHRIFQWQKSLRHAEYHINNKNNIIHYLLWMFWARRKNKLGAFLGIDIPENTFEKGLRIYHFGCISVNANAKVGEDCILVGNNCLGNKHGQNIGPKLGNGCMLGFGSSIIGDVHLENQVSIAVGAVVTKSFFEDNISLVGVPARTI